MPGALTGPLTGQAIYVDSATQVHPLGTRGYDRLGRCWRYALAGASNLVAGNALQSAAQIPNHQKMTPSAAAIGARLLTVTPGATAGGANLYENGLVIVDTTPGLGYSYVINGHAAITSSTAFDVELLPGWFVQVALTASSTVTLCQNPYAGVIQAPVTTATGGPAGVAQFIITAAQYGWVGTGGGVFGTLIQGTPAVGTPVGVPSSTAGSVGAVLGTDAAVPTSVCGHMHETGEDGLVQAVRWTLD